MPLNRLTPPSVKIVLSRLDGSSALIHKGNCAERPAALKGVRICAPSASKIVPPPASSTRPKCAALNSLIALAAAAIDANGAAMASARADAA